MYVCMNACTHVVAIGQCQLTYICRAVRVHKRRHVCTHTETCAHAHAHAHMRVFRELQN